MDNQGLVSLVDQLIGESSEREWVEFKENYFEPQMLGRYISALANSACVTGKDSGYLVFGINNVSHSVVGTDFDPHTCKGKGNQDLIIWLSTALRSNVGFEFHTVAHPQGRVVLLEVRAANGRPVLFFETAYIRIGSSVTELKNYPEKEREIWSRRFDWSAQICSVATLADLDPEALRKAREQFIIKHPAQANKVSEWDDVTFLNKAKLAVHGNLTNTAILLLGRTEAASLLSPAVARISWILKNSNNQELDYQHLGPPFILSVDKVLNRIRNLNVRALPSGTLFPQEISQYDPWVIREALHNCIAHQDYGLRGRINLVETPEAIILTNLGSFLPGDVEKVVRQDAPPEIYRNSFLAEAMVELNMIDTQGGGIKRMFETQRQRYFPLPDFDLSEPNRVVVKLQGRILDEQYTQLLMVRGDLNLWQVMMLDHVQKRLPIPQEAHRELKKAGLIEGRYPNLIVAGPIAKATGQKARHIRDRGFDKKYYLDMILALIQEHGPVDRKEVDAVLIRKLPEVLTEDQKKTKIHNLLSELARNGKIVNKGTRTKSQWQVANNIED